MKNRKIPGAGISAVITLQSLGSALVLGSGTEAAQDSWFAVLLATLCSLLLAWLYSAVLRLFPGEGLYGVAMRVFGGTGGKIFCGIYVSYAVFLGAEVFRILNEFIQLVNLPGTPQIAILALTVPVIALQVRAGLSNLAECARFLLPVVLVFIVSMFLLGLRFMDPGNIMPVLGSGAGAISRGAFSALAIPLGETVLCLPFFREADSSVKPFRTLAAGLLTGGGTLVLATLRNTLLLGAPTCRMYYFASYEAVGVISVGDFITRISVLIGINLVLASTVKIGTFVYAASAGVSQILGLRGLLKPAAPCAVLMAALGFTLYDNLLSGMALLKYLSVFSVPFQFLLPGLLLVCGKIRRAAGRRRAPAAARKN